MAIKYYTNPEKKQVIAVMSGTRYDAVNRMAKMMNAENSEFIMSPHLFTKYLMPEQYKVTVTCDERDVYDEEVGKQVAKKKLLRNYYKSVDKRIAMFKRDIANFIKTWNETI